MTRPAAAPPSTTNRSRITNGKALLAGVNGCSAMARRYRDLVCLLSAEIGGDLGEAESLQVKAAASLQLHVEDLTARVVRGEPVDPEAMTRAANGAMRALAALRRRKAARRPAGRVGLTDYLASKDRAA